MLLIILFTRNLAHKTRLLSQLSPFNGGSLLQASRFKSRFIRDLKLKINPSCSRYLSRFECRDPEGRFTMDHILNRWFSCFRFSWGAVFVVPTLQGTFSNIMSLRKSRSLRMVFLTMTNSYKPSRIPNSEATARKPFWAARLTQLLEHEILNFRVVGSCPTLGAIVTNILWSFPNPLSHYKWRLM